MLTSDFFDILLQVIYRIKLPGPALLGEGKPENQNHAIIFTRGEGLQTIDMNQVLEPYLYGVCMCVFLCGLCVCVFAHLENIGNLV